MAYLPTYHRNTKTHSFGPWDDVGFFSLTGFITGWWFQPIWKNIGQIGSFPQVGVQIENIWNHHLHKNKKLELTHLIFQKKTRSQDHAIGDNRGGPLINLEHDR